MSEWMREAACLGNEGPMWDENTPSTDALRFCFRCPVRPQCVRYGLKNVDASDAGVLGGLGFYDREKIRAGKLTVEDAWALRLAVLVAADWDEAVEEDFVRTMPRLEMA